MRTATQAKCTQSVHATEAVHLDAQSLNDRFSATIYHLPVKTIARISGASLDAAKSWRTGRRFPQWEYLRRLQSIPAVREFVAHEFGFTGSHATGILASLQHFANDSTPEAAEARALLRSLTRD